MAVFGQLITRTFHKGILPVATAQKIQRPLKRFGTRLITVDQDSADHQAQQIWTSLHYEPGQFEANPLLGVRDQAGRMGGADLEEMRADIADDVNVDFTLEHNAALREALIQQAIDELYVEVEDDGV